MRRLVLGLVLAAAASTTVQAEDFYSRWRMPDDGLPVLLTLGDGQDVTLSPAAPIGRVLPLAWVGFSPNAFQVTYPVTLSDLPISAADVDMAVSHSP